MQSEARYGGRNRATEPELTVWVVRHSLWHRFWLATEDFAIKVRSETSSQSLNTQPRPSPGLSHRERSSRQQYVL